MRARSVHSSPLGSHRAAALLVLLGLCAGCGSSGSSSSGELSPNGSFDTGAPAPASTAGAPSTIPTAELFDTVLKRYRAYQAAYKKAYEQNDPSVLHATVMDPLLTKITNDVEARRAKGEIWRFTRTFNPRVYARSKDSTKIYVIDCIRPLVGYRYSAKTGERLGGGPAETRLFRTTLQYDSGTWKAAASVRDKKC